MSRFIVVLAGLFAMFPFYTAVAAENGRFALNEKWKRQQACQADQAAQLRSLEAEAECSFPGIDAKPSSSPRVNRSGNGAPALSGSPQTNRQQP
ncbi:MAG: hypothetical protein HY914_02930 [Desulfomonile tiedjei]|nr:hypothetical protein [Desulfomonile tiedjei]